LLRLAHGLAAEITGGFFNDVTVRQEAKVLQDLAVELGTRRLPCSWVAEEHSVKKHVEGGQAVELALVVHLAYLDQLPHISFDVRPANLFVDLREHRCKLGAVRRVFPDGVSDFELEDTWVKVRSCHRAIRGLFESLAHGARVAEPLAARGLEQPPYDNFPEPRVGLRPPTLLALAVPHLQQLLLVEVFKHHFGKPALQARVIGKELVVHFVLIASDDNSEPFAVVLRRGHELIDDWGAFELVTHRVQVVGFVDEENSVLRLLRPGPKLVRAFLLQLLRRGLYEIAPLPQT